MSWLTDKLRSFFGLTRIEQIVVKQSLLEDLGEMARDAHPKEMFAFIAASQGIQSVLTIDELHLQAYSASEYAASFSTGQLPTSSNIVGTAHSHPSPSNRPSAQDQRMFGQFGMVHMILCRPYTIENVAVYNKDGSRVSVVIRN